MKVDDPVREDLLGRQCCRTLVGAAACLLAGLSLTACATLGGLKDEPLDRGTSRPMAADYEAVVSAARAAVQDVGLWLAEDYPVNDSAWAIFCEAGGLFDTGAVVRVVVQRLGEKQTVVRVISRARNRGQWLLNEWSVLDKVDFSQDILDALSEELEGKRRLFAADYESVVSAVREGVQEVGFSLGEDYVDNDGTWVIPCAKYGQTLRVVVQRLDEKQTSVRVISHPRGAIGSFEMEGYSQDIFAALIEKLEREPHVFAADYESVVSAAREGTQEVGLELRVDYPVNDSTWVILCGKNARFLRVVVQRLGEKQTAVRVIFRRGEGVEVWRMEDYSQEILAVLVEKLEEKP